MVLAAFPLSTAVTANTTLADARLRPGYKKLLDDGALLGRCDMVRSRLHGTTTPCCPLRQ